MRKTPFPPGRASPKGGKDRRAAVDAVRARSEHADDDRDAAEADQTLRFPRGLFKDTLAAWRTVTTT